MGWDAAIPNLAPDHAAQLARLPTLVVPKGSILFRPGDPAKGFVLVLQGRIEVHLTGPTGREILLYAVEPGQSCVQTTLGLLGGELYTGEALAATDAQIVIIPKRMFLAQMDSDPGFRSFVLQAFARRMQDVTRLLERVAFGRVEGDWPGHFLTLQKTWKCMPHKSSLRRGSGPRARWCPGDWMPFHAQAGLRRTGGRSGSSMFWPCVILPPKLCDQITDAIVAIAYPLLTRRTSWI